MLNDSLVDAANLYRQNGGEDGDSFVSGFDLLGAMSDSALQEAGDAATVFQSIYGEQEVFHCFMSCDIFSVFSIFSDCFYANFISKFSSFPVFPFLNLFLQHKVT